MLESLLALIAQTPVPAASPTDLPLLNTVEPIASETLNQSLDISFLSIGIYGVLFAFSIVSWSIMIKKFIDIRAEKKRAAKFRRLFADLEGDIVALSQEGILPTSSPARLFVAAYEELRQWATLDRTRNCIVASRQILAPLERTLDRSIELEKDRLDHGTTLLATIATVSPLLGLLGTVWGIYLAFTQMGMAEDTSLRTVSQGVSEALLTTVAGLLVAIPAAFAYNVIARAIRSIENHLESFAYEIVNHFEHQIVIDPAFVNRPAERVPLRKKRSAAP